MSKFYLISAVICLLGLANANLLLDISNMVTNDTEIITATGLVDETTGSSVDVTMTGQGPNTGIIKFTDNQGYGVHGEH